jgi:heme oxygenase (biliverdin-IX-beta and delta-forming)
VPHVLDQRCQPETEAFARLQACPHAHHAACARWRVGHGSRDAHLEEFALGVSLAIRHRRVVPLLQHLQAETELFHADADKDGVHLLGPVSASDYLRFLVRTHGFVTPVERSILASANLEQHIDTRRFHKHELLRRDLLTFRLSPDEIDRLPQATIPLFDRPEAALGWAFVIERGARGHSNLFRHLAMAIPGEVAFTSSYLKCYFGSVGEMWRSFGTALERFADPTSRSRLVEAAKSAFRTLRQWRHHLDTHDRAQSTPASGKQRIA